MAVMTFAAIDIGSYEVSMKIFEMSKRIGFRELNDVRYSLEIGKGVYSDMGTCLLKRKEQARYETSIDGKCL